MVCSPVVIPESEEQPQCQTALNPSPTRPTRLWHAHRPRSVLHPIIARVGVLMQGIASGFPVRRLLTDPRAAAACASLSMCCLCSVSAHAIGSALVPAHVQPDPNPPPARVPNERDAATAFAMVSRWLDDWTLPAQPGSETAFLPGDGACVVIRLNGRVIGRGASIAGGGDPDRPDRDAQDLWRAARDALAEADGRLPIDNDALRSDAVKELRGAITLSVELAAPLAPVRERTWEDLEAVLAPGLDGVAVRWGGPGGVVKSMFPSVMMATNTLPHRAVSSLVAAVGDAPGVGLLRPVELAERHGVTIYRFRCVHAAQLPGGDVPTFPYRGSRIVRDSDITGPSLRAMADDAASHVIRRVSAAGDRPAVIADYDPCLDRFDDAAAAVGGAGGGTDALLAALALAMYSRVHGLAPAQAELAREAAIRLLDEWAQVDHKPADDPVAAAFAVAAMRRLHRDEADARQVREKGAATLLRAFDLQKGFTADAPRPAKAAIAFGLVELASLGKSLHQPWASEAKSKAEAATRMVMRDTPLGELVGLMPFAGWAELELARLNAQPPASAVLLREMRALMWANQLQPSDLADDSLDLGGGIVFTASRNPMPSWHAARPLAFIATMLGDDRLTDEPHRLTELMHLLASARFLRQLQADEWTSWLYPNPTRARGGIRSAVWDHRVPADATCMTLMTICELLNSMDRLSSQRPAAVPE